MTEHLLQFIWQFQYFNSASLITTTGEAVQVIKPGLLNREQGPDFRDAKIRIGDTTWAGSVELHLKTSDWNKHHHQQDNNYKNVILHVVWEHDLEVNKLPVLELRSRISNLLLNRYENLMISSSFIPCENLVTSIPDITWKTWKERLIVERLIRKAGSIRELLERSDFHWEETFWRLLARSFGMKTNGDAFDAIARSLPLTILAKHKGQIHQLESLLLGQAGLLDRKMNDDYAKLLQREYRFLKKKYNINPIPNAVHFLRMRPPNFPSIRLAQLAMLVHQSAHLFSRIKDTNTVAELRNWFDVAANDYWHYHYRLDITSPFRIKKLGDGMIDHIIINTICPVLFTYGLYHDETAYKQKALNWMDDVKAEKNKITQMFAQLNFENKSACDSQALLELKNEYCDKRRCLECGIGNSILKQKEQ